MDPARDSLPRSVPVWLGLGANLGDRRRNLETALARLAATPGVRVEAVSTLRETDPVGGPPEPRYLNGAARLATTLDPHALLRVLQALEREAGREPSAVRNAPRPLDLDILLFGSERIDTRDLVVPHPRLFEREFVLEPLRELGVDVRALEPPARPLRLTAPEALRAQCAAWRRGRCTIGFVPTMGALHAGHRALLRRAREECDRVVASIFVNPLQFGAGEDFERYPRQLEADVAVCAEEGVDVVFAPALEAMYPPGSTTRVDVGPVARPMEGAVRPGHFTGVATVVCRLFALVEPDRAYFGQKDAQQLAVIRRMHADLGFGGAVVECPTVREPDGLALSSRNVYLDPGERRAATVLWRALSAAREAFDHGARDAPVILQTAALVLESEPLCAVDYLELRSEPDLAELPEQPIVAARLLVAARFGATRLIDNIRLGGEPRR